MRKQKTDREWSRIHLVLHAGMFFCTMCMLTCAPTAVRQPAVHPLVPGEQSNKAYAAGLQGSSALVASGPGQRGVFRQGALTGRNTVRGQKPREPMMPTTAQHSKVSELGPPSV